MNTEWSTLRSLDSSQRCSWRSPPHSSSTKRSVLGRMVHRRVYVTASLGRRFIVVAASLKISENDIDIFESPFG